MKNSTKVAIALGTLAIGGAGVAFLVFRKPAAPEAPAPKVDPAVPKVDAEVPDNVEFPEFTAAPVEDFPRSPGIDVPRQPIEIDVPEALDPLPGIDVVDDEIHVDVPTVLEPLPDELEEPVIDVVEDVLPEVPGVDVGPGGEVVIDVPEVVDALPEVPGVDVGPGGELEVDIPELINELPIELPPGFGIDVPIARPPVKLPSIPPQPAPPKNPPPPIAPVTSAMVDALINAEQSPNWKRVSEEVKAWQAANGMAKVDGMLGPASNLRLALEVGTLPLVRFWPKGTTAPSRNAHKVLEDYRAAINDIAATVGGTHGTLLRRSAQREQGQAFGLFAKPDVPAASDGKVPVPL